MFARGWVCLHTACPERGRRARLPVPKISSSKPCVSITSKVIENARLQVLYFGHLRKTGGRGSYQFLTMLDLTDVEESLLPTPLFPLHTKIPLVSPFFPLLTQKQGSIPPENVGAPTFLIFPHIFHTFLALSAIRRVARHSPARRSFSAGRTTCYLKGAPISV